jgi:hypothetical protein
MIQSFQPSSKSWGIEIHEQSGRASGELQICDDLSKVDGMQAFDRLELHDHAPFDKQIQFERSANPVTFVLERNMPLAFDADARSPQLDNHAFPIDRLQQPRSEQAMHFNRAADDLFRERLNVLENVRHLEQESTKRACLIRERYRADSFENGRICDETIRSLLSGVQRLMTFENLVTS